MAVTTQNAIIVVILIILLLLFHLRDGIIFSLKSYKYTRNDPAPCLFLTQTTAPEHARVKREALLIAPHNPLIMHLFIETVNGTKHLLGANPRAIM